MLQVPASADNIATFVEVVRRHSLSAAARQLELPKSTVSRRLLRLEQQLQTKLLHRDARKVTLSAAGRRFYESVVGAVDSLDAAIAALERSSTEAAGNVRITAPPDLGRMVLAPMFVAFLKQHTEISLDLLFTNRFVNLAEEGVDLAVRAGRVTEGDLIARRLCTAELQLAVSPQLSLSAIAAEARGSAREQNEDDVQSLARLPFVLYRATKRSQTLRLERSAPKKRRVVEVEVSGRVSVDDYAAMGELIAAGQGVGLMPSLHVQEGALAGRLVRLFPAWAARASPIYLVSATRQQPERVRLLAEFLLRAFASVATV